MKLQQNLNERERLINLIHACNDKAVKKQWIIELSNTDIECSESQCDSCPIAVECIDILMPKELKEYVSYTPECIECRVMVCEAQLCTGCQTYLDYNGGEC